MNKVAKWEYVVVGCLLLLLATTLYPSLRYARREKRDGIRREALATLKTDMEQYYNKHNTYPLEFSADPYLYIVTEKDSKGAIGWYLRTQLENFHAVSAGFDLEGGHNFYYRVVDEGGSTWYDICGGQSTCGAEKRN